MPNLLRLLVTLSLLATLLLPQIVIAAENEEDTAVLVIAGEDELANAAFAHPYLAVLFKVEWCEHCKELAPEWASAALELKRKGSKIALAMVNGEDQPNFKLNVKYGLKAFPTIKIVSQGDIDHPFNYTGPRTASGIVQYLEQHFEAMPQELTSKKQVENFEKQKIDTDVGAKKPAIVAYIGTQPTHFAAKIAFLHMSDTLVGQIVAAYTTDPSLLLEKDHKCSSPSRKTSEQNSNDCDSPFAIMMKPGEKKHPRYQGDFSTDLLIKWATSHATPLVSRYLKSDKDALKEFSYAFQVPLPHVIIAVAKARDITTAALTLISEAAEANDDLKFTITSSQDGEGAPLLKSLGVAEDAPAPLFIIFDALKNEMYLKTGMKLENLPEFLEEYKVGALTPFGTSTKRKEMEKEGEAKAGETDEKIKSSVVHSEL
jgi:thiol-disulfide isomerase/thioredoxin